MNPGHEKDADTSLDTSFDGGAHELHCLRCSEALRFEELGALAADAVDRAYFDCTVCGARNEVRAEPQPGLGAPPKPVVVRVLEEAGS